MSAGHRPKPMRSCAHCGEQFIVNPRVGKRHRFCSRPACAQASRRAAQKKWLRKNGGNRYFAGEKSLVNARAWRKRHPRYWRRAHRHQGRQPGAFRLTRKLKAALRYVALQDEIDTRLALKIGLFSRLSGVASQDAIAREIRATMLHGHAILHGQPIPKAR